VNFISKERNGETGLDYFGARYFSGAQGRFTSPDPKMFPHDITDPQSWNKYGYTRNNPLRYVDPDGADWQDRLKGAINAFTSNNTAGVGRISGGNSDFRVGQAIGDAVSTVTGTIETLAGTGGEVLGGALDLTGVGAAVGVPITVVSAGAIAHGATTGLISGVHLVQDASDATSSGEPQRKQGGAITEPNLPDKTVVKQDGVSVEHYTRSGDHGPPHLHVSGEGPSTRIGQAGRPLSGDPELSSRQAQVVQETREPSVRLLIKLAAGSVSMNSKGFHHG
jgi:RHS repeat-associated protein